MNWRWWERGPRKLSRGVKQYLEKKFSLSDIALGNLMMVTQRGLWSGKPAIFIRILDPLKLAEITLVPEASLDYQSFDPIPNFPGPTPSEAILYEGHQEGSFIFLAKKNS